MNRRADPGDEVGGTRTKNGLGIRRSVDQSIEQLVQPREERIEQALNLGPNYKKKNNHFESLQKAIVERGVQKVGSRGFSGCRPFAT